MAGAPLARTVERVVDGELSAEHHEALATTIRQLLPPGGFQQIAVLGRSISLSTFVNGGLVDLQVMPKDGMTIVRASVNFRNFAGGVFGGLIGGLGGGLGSNIAWIVPVLCAQAGLPGPVGVAGGAVGLLATVLGAWALGRSLFSGRARDLHTKVEQLVEALEGQLRSKLNAVGRDEP